MKGGFDLFGKALLAYTKGDRTDFYFEDSTGQKYNEDIAKFFREKKAYYPLERKIVSLSKGEILDIGCGTGGFIPGLMKRGKVLGIDNSKIMIDICKKRGIRNVRFADIYRWKTKKKFDTICLLDENIGITESVKGLKILLKKLATILKKDRQILANIEDIIDNYEIWRARCVWKGEKGKYFRWIRFNSQFLVKLCGDLGLKAKIIARDGKRYIIKIEK
jgi:SAM-dependent methyltransferase